MGKEYHCQHEGEEEHRSMENQEIQYELAEEDLMHSKATKELGIMENKVITDIAFQEVESDRMALMNSTKSVSKFFKSKMRNKELNSNKSKHYTMDGLDKILGQERCELCNRFFKNIRGLTVHKYKMHAKAEVREQEEVQKGKFNQLKALQNTGINTVDMGDPSHDVILPAFVENNAISLLEESRRLFLRRRLRAQTEVKGESRVIAAESIRTWSATQSNYVNVNMLSDNVLHASNIPQHFSRTADEQNVNEMKCNITQSVVIYHQSLCSDSENKSQSLTIEEVGDSTLEHNMTDATYINKKETRFPAKEPCNSKLNGGHTAITDFTKENVMSKTSPFNRKPLSDAVSSLKTRKCRNKNKRLCYMKYHYLKRRIANGIKEESVCCHENSRNPEATTSKTENIANSVNTIQIPKHSQSDIKPDKVKNASVSVEKLGIPKKESNNNKLSVVENLKMPLNKKIVKEVKNTRSAAKSEAAIVEQEMPNSVIPHKHKVSKRIQKSKASQRINLKKKKAYVLKLGSQKYYLVKKKRFKICTLIGKHKPRILTRSKKKHKEQTSNICSSTVVEDLTKESEDFFDKSKTNNTEQNSRTSMVRPNCNNLKDLKVSLIRVDHIPPSELKKLIKKSDGTENFNGKAETKKRGKLRKIRHSKSLTADNEKHDGPIYKSRVDGEGVEEIPNGENKPTVEGASEAVLHTEGHSVIQGLWSELPQQEDSLPCETQEDTSLEAEELDSEVIVTKEKRAISIVDNVKLDEAHDVKKDSILLKTLKHNSKRKLETLNESNSKKSKLNDGMLKLDTKAQSDSHAKPENRMKLNNEIISMTKENICYVCDKNFNTRNALSEHMFFIHDASFDNSIVYELLHNRDKKSSLPKTADVVCEETASSEPQKEEDQFEDFTEEEDETDEVPYDDIPHLANESIKGSRKWRCRICKENFGLLRNYLRHKYYSHNDETVVHVCDNCTKVLTSVAMVNVHVCTNVTSWICRRCNLEFPNGISLGRHNINRHLEVIGPHTCNACDLTFLTNYMLERHSSIHHFTNGINKTNSTSCEDGTSTVEFFKIKVKQPFSIRRAFWLPKKDEVENYVSDSMLTSLRRKNQCRCMICNEIYPNKLLTKLHLEKQHNICVDICQLCNGFFLAGKVVCHLIDRHIISDNLVLKGGEVNDKIIFETMEDAQYDLIKVLGLKRLVDIYSYQRFNNTMQNGQYNCHICLRKFLTNQEYKHHYLKEHDTVCILCNVEFENSVKAMDHKLKNHTSAETYLWAIQSIVTSLLMLEKQGSMIAAVADKLRQMRICDCERTSTTPQKCKYKDNFASTFKTEILEVAAQHKNVTLSMRVECEENVSKPGTSQARSNAPINESDKEILEPCTPRASQSVSSSNSVSVILVTEEDLLLYKDNIKALASKLCSSCTMYTEEYITVLLTNYMQSLVGNNYT